MNKLDALLFFPDIPVEPSIDTGRQFFFIILPNCGSFKKKKIGGGKCVRINIIYFVIKLFECTFNLFC